ncbi:hypothetical protein ABI59_20210 [Acidobacteria bacterium Mor1]|nr:hypothetical protein ABI59_20210 [Acidobacteria bacterium Mor1]
MAATYRIADEPRPGGLQHLVVSPIWPLLAVMFAGHTISWVWFAVNSIAMGSPTKKREIGLVVAGFVGVLLLRLGIVLLVGAEAVSDPYLTLPVMLLQLGMAYALFTLQSRTFGIYEYFGGIARNGLMVVFLGAFVWRRLAAAIAEVPFLNLMLLG